MDSLGPLLTDNPNSSAPFRLDRNQASTCDNDNHYTDEQKAYHGGLARQISGGHQFHRIRMPAGAR